MSIGHDFPQSSDTHMEVGSGMGEQSAIPTPAKAPRFSARKAQKTSFYHRGSIYPESRRYQPDIEEKNGAFFIPKDLCEREGILQPPSQSVTAKLNQFQQDNLERAESDVHNIGVRLKAQATPVAEYQIVGIYHGQPIRSRKMTPKELKQAGLWDGRGNKPEHTLVWYPDQDKSQEYNGLPHFQAHNENIGYRVGGSWVSLGVDAINSPFPISHINCGTDEMPSNIVLLPCLSMDSITQMKFGSISIKQNIADDAYCLVAVADRNIKPGDELLMDYQANPVEEPDQNKRTTYFRGADHYFNPVVSNNVPLESELSLGGNQLVIYPAIKNSDIDMPGIREIIQKELNNNTPFSEIASALRGYRNPFTGFDVWNSGDLQYLCELANIPAPQEKYNHLGYLFYCQDTHGQLDNNGKNYLEGFIRFHRLNIRPGLELPESLSSVKLFLEAVIDDLKPVVETGEGSAEAADRIRQINILQNELAELTERMTAIETHLRLKRKRRSSQDTGQSFFPGNPAIPESKESPETSQLSDSDWEDSSDAGDQDYQSVTASDPGSSPASEIPVKSKVEKISVPRIPRKKKCREIPLAKSMAPKIKARSSEEILESSVTVEASPGTKEFSRSEFNQWNKEMARVQREYSVCSRQYASTCLQYVALRKRSKDADLEAVKHLKKLKIPVSTYGAIKHSGQWGIGHIRYLQWKFEGDKNKRFQLMDKPFGDALRVLDPLHPDTELLLRECILHALDIEEPGIYHATVENKRIRKVKSWADILNKRISSAPDRTPIPVFPWLEETYQNKTWGQEMLRYLLTSDGVYLIMHQQDKFDNKDLLGFIKFMDQDSEFYFPMIMHFFENIDFNIHRKYAGCMTNFPQLALKLPEIDGLELHKEPLSQASMFLWTLTMEGDLAKVPEIHVTNNILCKCLRMIKEPNKHPETWKKIFSIMASRCPDEKMMKDRFTQLNNIPMLAGFDLKTMHLVVGDFPKVTFKEERDS